MFKGISLYGRAAACTLLLALAGCGGGGGGADPAPAAAAGPQPVQVDTTRTARSTLGAAGGSISATAADGRRYTLQVPPGALAANTDITATPVTSMGAAPLAAGLKAAVRFGPAGLKFAVPALLRIEGAATTVNSAASGKRLVGFVRADNGSTMSLQLPAQAAAALELQVPHFSDVGVSEASLAELALVPIVTPASVADELFDAATREMPVPASGAPALATVLAGLHDRIVQRELDGATRADTPEARLVAATAFGIWDRVIELGTADDAQYAAVVALLGDRYVLSRARAGAFLKKDVDAGLAACAAQAPIGATQQEGLKSALSLQLFAQQRGLDDADLGLDGDTVARRANACARVAFVPKPAPAFNVGTAVSLDTQAEVIFAADANFRAAQPLAFSVGSSAARVATPEGVGDVAGRYTTVVTPSAAAPLFDVKACLMVVVPVPVVFMPEGQLMASVMCGKQQLGGNATIILSGIVDVFRFSPRVQIGSVRLRVRFDSEGKFTVLEASGGTSDGISTDGGVCNPFPPDGRSQVKVGFVKQSAVTVVTGGQQSPVLAAGRFIIFNLTGTHTASIDQIQGDCRVVAKDISNTNAGSVQVLSIERDAQNLPLAMVMGDASQTHSGRLVRE